MRCIVTWNTRRPIGYHRLPIYMSVASRFRGCLRLFAAPGLRIGWLVTHDHDFLRHAGAYKDYTTICNSAPSEILGLMALRARAEIVNRNLAIIRTNLAAAAAFFAAHADRFRWLPPQAGSVAFPQLTTGQPVTDFCRDLLAARSLMVLPGDGFAVGGNHFRVGLGRRNFMAALEVLDAYLT